MTAQAVGILTLAVGPLLVSLVLLGLNSGKDAALDRQIVARREIRLQETQLLKQVLDAETAVRGFLLTRDDAFLGPYQGAAEAIPELLAKLGEHEHLEENVSFHQAEELAVNELTILMRLLEGSAPQQALLVEAKERMDQFRDNMNELISLESRAITQLQADRDATAGSSRLILLGGGAASAVSAIVGGALLMAGIVRRLRVVTDNARRVAEGEDLMPVRGDDEIGRLARELERSAQLLRARESQLRQAVEEADRANQAKSDFISRMSHELRTPLNAILGFAQMLREEADETAASDVKQILRAGRHLLALINEVLDLARIESGQFAISQEPVAVAEVLDECVELIVPLAATRGIQIVNAPGPGSDLHVLADRQRLKQVFLNLLSNAVKYNRDNGRVELSCSTHEDRVRLTVRDTGPGIPEKGRDALFTPFARLGAEATEVEGSGLGLALSLRLMQMMDGDMDVAHTGPDGTEFWLELALADPTGLVTGLEVAGSAAELPEVEEGSPVTILQVEDNPTNIRLLERILSRRPHIRLVTVEQGGLAVQAAKDSQPRLVLLDVNLPDISGREVLARLRADPATARIPVVMLSADASANQIERLLASGAVAYVTKPLDVNHFLSVVDDVLTHGNVDIPREQQDQGVDPSPSSEKA